MRQVRRNKRNSYSILMALACLLTLAGCIALPLGTVHAGPQEARQQSFASPEDAVTALTAAVRANDRYAFTMVVGSALDQLASGDEVQDSLTLMTFAKQLVTRCNLVKTNDATAVLYIGDEHILFRLPLRLGSKGWYFDVEAGRQQLLERQMGQNERRALEVCRIYFKAQRAYAAEDRDGDGVLEYATKLLSSPGARDGLYWPNADKEPESPFGPLVSLARSQGYRDPRARQEPFQGYYFRVLVRQGPSAPGDTKEYIVINGNMTEGFGMVAYPARWGVSGIMTFVVGPDGRVFEKNLGQTTMIYASAMSEFNPDETWSEVTR